MTSLVTLDDVEAIREPREIALLSNARRMLAEARTIDEVKTIRDQAEALRLYARQQKWGLEAQNAAAEIKLRAERRAGKLLLEIDLKPGRRKENCSHDDRIASPKVSDFGIDQNQSKRWEHVASVKSFDRELTTASTLKLAKQLKAQETTEPEWEPECGGNAVRTLGELIAAGRKFRTVYADPPWQYSNQGTRASTDNHYGTMDLDAICAEPVTQVVEDNAHLHLWTTNAFLFDAKRVMEAWGFTYKSCFIWCKPQMGIGNYWRVSHEFLLFGIRGKEPFRVRDEMSWAEVPRGEHSEKPDGFRQKVERVSPGPYLEMYGRVAMPGSPWTVYGNQVAKRLF